MSNLQVPNIKLTVSKSEIEEIDKAIEMGLGKSRADVCRKATILYLKSHNLVDSKPDNAVQVVFGV